GSRVCGNQDIRIAVTVIVPHRQTAPGPGLVERLSRAGGHLLKVTPAARAGLVVEQLQPLLVTEGARRGPDLLVDVAIGGEDVRVAIQIVIEEASAKGGERQARLEQSRRFRPIRVLPGCFGGPEQSQPLSREVADKDRLPAG